MSDNTEANKGEEVGEEYAASLADLTFNSKPLITMLTQLAEENSEYAPFIVKRIERHVEQVRPDVQLPAMYLVDSIIKNLGTAYMPLFSVNIHKLFTKVYEQVKEPVRTQLRKLRQTWTGIVPQSTLQAIDVNIHKIDPSWSIANSNIHLNPKFFPLASTTTISHTPVITTAAISSKANVNNTSAKVCKDTATMELRKKQEELLLLKQKKQQLARLKAKKSVASSVPINPNRRVIKNDPNSGILSRLEAVRHLISKVENADVATTEPQIQEVIKSLKNVMQSIQASLKTSPQSALKKEEQDVVKPLMEKLCDLSTLVVGYSRKTSSKAQISKKPDTLATQKVAVIKSRVVQAPNTSSTVSVKSHSVHTSSAIGGNTNVHSKSPVETSATAVDVVNSATDAAAALQASQTPLRILPVSSGLINAVQRVRDPRLRKFELSQCMNVTSNNTDTNNTSSVREESKASSSQLPTSGVINDKKSKESDKSSISPPSTKSKTEAPTSTRTSEKYSIEQKTNTADYKMPIVKGKLERVNKIKIKLKNNVAEKSNGSISSKNNEKVSSEQNTIITTTLNPPKEKRIQKNAKITKRPKEVDNLYSNENPELKSMKKCSEKELRLGIQKALSMKLQQLHKELSQPNKLDTIDKNKKNVQFKKFSNVDRKFLNKRLFRQKDDNVDDVPFKKNKIDDDIIQIEDMEIEDDTSKPVEEIQILAAENITNKMDILPATKLNKSEDHLFENNENFGPRDTMKEVGKEKETIETSVVKLCDNNGDGSGETNQDTQLMAKSHLIKNSNKALTILEQAKEDLTNGRMSFEEYNKVMMEALKMNELEDLSNEELDTTIDDSHEKSDNLKTPLDNKIAIEDSKTLLSVKNSKQSLHNAKNVDKLFESSDDEIMMTESDKTRSTESSGLVPSPIENIFSLDEIPLPSSRSESGLSTEEHNISNPAQKLDLSPLPIQLPLTEEETILHAKIIAELASSKTSTMDEKSLPEDMEVESITGKSEEINLNDIPIPRLKTPPKTPPAPIIRGEFLDHITRPSGEKEDTDIRIDHPVCKTGNPFGLLDTTLNSSAPVRVSPEVKSKDIDYRQVFFTFPASTATSGKEDIDLRPQLNISSSKHSRRPSSRDSPPSRSRSTSTSSNSSKNSRKSFSSGSDKRKYSRNKYKKKSKSIISYDLDTEPVSPGSDLGEPSSPPPASNAIKSFSPSPLPPTLEEKMEIEDAEIKKKTSAVPFPPIPPLMPPSLSPSPPPLVTDNFDRTNAGASCPPPPFPPVMLPMPLATVAAPSLPEIPPTDSDLLKIIDEDTTLSIKIDNTAKDIRFYGDKAIIFLSWDDPHEISFYNGVRNMVIDDRFIVSFSFNSPDKEIILYGAKYRMRLGVPTREIYINGKGYQCQFNGVPVLIKFGVRNCPVKLEGPPPSVHIGPMKRLDLVAGKIFIIIDSGSVPIYLDAKPQRIEVDDISLILQFADQLKRVLINNQPFLANFGGPPQAFSLFGKTHYFRLSALPSHTEAGFVNIQNMLNTRLPSPPPIPPSLISTSYEPLNLPTMQFTTTSLANPVVSNNVIAPAPSIMKLETQTMSDTLKPPVMPPLSMLLDMLPNSSTITSEVINQPDVTNTTQAEDYKPSLDAEPSSLGSVQNILGTLNIDELFQKLVASGIVKSSTSNSNDDEEDDQTTLKEVDLLKPETLKQRQPTIVSTLYSGIQCDSCGLRYSIDETDKYNKHLDWHLQQNLKGVENITRTRKWYYKINEWIPFEEMEDADDRAHNWFETQQVTLTDDEPMDYVEYVSVKELNENAMCELCQDKFEQSYNEEKQEWRLKNAVKFDEKIYHLLCYEDFKNKPTEAEILDSVEPTNEVVNPAEEVNSEETAEPVDNSNLGKIETDMMEIKIKEEKIDSPSSGRAQKYIPEPNITSEEINKNGKEDEYDSDIEEVQVIEPVIEHILIPDDMELDPNLETLNMEEIMAVSIQEPPPPPEITLDEEEEEEPIVISEPLELGKIDITHSDMGCSIDGNVEMDETPQQLFGSSKIKINITKPVVENCSPKPEENIPIPNVEAENMEQSQTKTISPHNFEEPPPPGEEKIVELKPKLAIQKLDEYPPVKKGHEISALCSIM